MPSFPASETFSHPLWSNNWRDSVPSGVFMRALRCALVSVLVVCLISVCTVSLVLAAGPSVDSAAPPILPKQFAGWQIQDAAQTSKDASAADPTNAALLKEYGFTDFEAATYKSDDG